MVTPGGDLQRERLYHKFMDTTPKRSKPLHNFSMPPDLRWGNRMFLRCMKVNSNGQILASSPDLKHHHHHHHSGFSQVQSSSEVDKRPSPPSSNAAVSKKKKNSVIRRLPLPQHPKTIGGVGDKSKIRTSSGGGDDGIEEIRAKLLVHLRTAAHQMKFEIPKERDDDDEEEEEEEEGEEEEEEEEESSALVEAAKPWNLRKRRAACNAPTTENGKVGGGGGGVSSRNEESTKQQQNSLPPLQRTENQTMKSLRLRGVSSITDQTREKERRKFSIPLSRKEIDEDFIAMLGTKPSRRPTKRPKIVQKHVDAIFPGLWLTEVTVDAYRVPDLVEPGKR